MGNSSKEFGFLDIVRPKQRMYCEDVWFQDKPFWLKTEIEGTILDEYENGKAYGVEFILQPAIVKNNEIIDYGEIEYLILKPEDLEMVKQYHGDRSFSD